VLEHSLSKHQLHLVCSSLRAIGSVRLSFLQGASAR
jgi:hypothetical protein